MEVINDLRHDARPIDRVYRHQTRALEERLISKTGFDHFLAIVKVSFNGDIVNIIAQRTGHLTTLYFRYPLMRVQNKDINILATAAAFNRSRTGITRGRTHNHHSLIALSEKVIEQTAKQLQCKVFKR